LSEKSGFEGFDVFDALFVGGGVIGLASAWRAAQGGARVCVLERAEPPAGATNVAAGMLAPVGELTFGERELLDLTLAAGALWADFAAAVEAAGGEATGFRQCGALHVALDRDEAGELRREHDLQRELGLEAEWLTPTRCRELEPGLVPNFVGGVLAASEAAVDPRALARVLAAALRAAGGELRTGTEVVDALWDGERLAGLRTAPSALTRPSDESVQTLDVHADAVVLCNGAWAGQADWLPEEARPPVRPVKGETVELRPRAGEGAPAARIVCSERVYLVPRPDGRLIVGATQEERGFDTVVTAGGVHELLREAYRVLPDVAEMEFAGAIAGLRPGTPDNLPIVGRGAVEGLVLATGHFRNGILLTPLTADAVAAILAGTEPPAAIAAADPARSSLARGGSVSLVAHRATKDSHPPVEVGR
jgi:glycine oxidase